MNDAVEQWRVPLWRALPSDVQTDLTRGGYDEAWFVERTSLQTLSALNLYGKLHSLGLWRFVSAPACVCDSCIEFVCEDVDELHALLSERSDFLCRPRGDGFWDARELRFAGSLHVKHFEGWPTTWIQTHVDATGALLRWWWWLLPVVPLVQLARHALHYNSYQDALWIRRLLLRQGVDPTWLSSE